MKTSLAEHMTARKLFLGALPSVFMMISISVYSVVDGFFVSNYAGKTAFAAVNLIYPLIMVIGSLGFMMGTGGAALVAKRLGEGDPERANRHFSNCVIFSLLLGIVSSAITYPLLPEIARWLGSDEEMLPYCVSYGRILVMGITAFNLQNLFQSFFMAAEKPTLGFLVTLLAGITNIVLDAALIVGAKMGAIGAAIGTVSGQAVGAVIPLIYFSLPNKSRLRLAATRFEWRSLGKMAANGMSEFFNNVSASAVSMVMNALLMKYYGQNGVSAYGIICYVWLIYAAVFIGFSMSVSARISFHYGAENKDELRSLYRKSLLILLILGVVQTALAEALAVPLSQAYAGYDAGLLDLTIKASRIYAFVYLFLGINMFGSAFFTALNNGVVSVFLAVTRLAALEIVCVVVLPLLVGGYGIFYGVVLAEGLGVFLNLGTMQAFASKYGYGGKKAAA